MKGLNQACNNMHLIRNEVICVMKAMFLEDNYYVHVVDKRSYCKNLLSRIYSGVHFQSNYAEFAGSAWLFFCLI